MEDRQLPVGILVYARHRAHEMGSQWARRDLEPPKYPVTIEKQFFCSRTMEASVGTWTIPVVVDADTAPDESKSLLSRGAAIVRTAVDAEKLKENMANLVKYLQQITATAAKVSSEFDLSEFEAGIEIRADRGVSLVGTVKAGATAPVTMVRCRLTYIKAAAGAAERELPRR